jgi:hypothetical protein
MQQTLLYGCSFCCLPKNAKIDGTLMSIETAAHRMLLLTAWVTMDVNQALEKTFM